MKKAAATNKQTNKQTNALTARYQEVRLRSPPLIPPWTGGGGRQTGLFVLERGISRGVRFERGYSICHRRAFSLQTMSR